MVLKLRIACALAQRDLHRLGRFTIATLLVDLVRRELPDANIASFAFRALRPTFAPNSFTVCGKPSEDGRTVELWAKDHDGYLTMRATATLA